MAYANFTIGRVVGASLRVVARFGEVIFAALFLALALVCGVETQAAAIVAVAMYVLVRLTIAWAETGRETLIASGFALFITWAHCYTYNSPSLMLGRINLFTFLMWTGGLLVICRVYRNLGVRHRWVAGCLVYYVLLGAIEYVGYFWIEIRLVPPMPSLLGLGIIHGPPLIHVFYPLAGPLYLALVMVLPTPLNEGPVPRMRSPVRSLPTG